MTELSKRPFHRDEDDEFLGYIVQDATGWQAQTIFGYTIERVETQRAAEKTLLEKGLGFLMGVWQYYDKDDHGWFPCVIKEAQAHRVTIIRTNAMGYQDPDDYKQLILTDPTDQILTKMS